MNIHLNKCSESVSNSLESNIAVLQSSEISEKEKYNNSHIVSKCTDKRNVGGTNSFKGSVSHYSGSDLEVQIRNELNAYLKILESRRAQLLRRLRCVTARGLAATVSTQFRHMLIHCNESLLSRKKEATNESYLTDERLYMSIHHSKSRSLSSDNEDKSVLPYHDCVELRALACEIQGAINAHKDHDSDATESSSGSESCDELEDYDTENTFYEKLKNRSFYWYNEKRSWISSRWAWLQSQLADLEYRILQQEKLYKHIRLEKEFVKLENLPSSEQNSVTEFDFGCARTSSLKRFKKRHLLSSSVVMEQHNKKFQSGQCWCNLPDCIICSKSQSEATTNFAEHDLSYRLFSVDSFYHPALSSVKDMLQSQYFDMLLKTKSWEEVITNIRKQHPSYHSRGPESVSERKNKERAYSLKKILDSQGRISSTKKYKSSSLVDMEIGIDDDNEFLENNFYSGASEKWSVDNEDANDSDDELSSNASSTAQGLSNISSIHTDRIQHRRNSNAANKNKNHSGNDYDIDNIIIPHRLIAPSRVEKLEYKEIPTPKWRTISMSPGQVAGDEEDDTEDVSDETCISRHSRSEELERKKFLQYLHMQVNAPRGAMRSRRTDSSGTNTPDHPLSPQNLEAVSGEVSSPIGSPPSTPLEPSEDSNHSCSFSANSPSTGNFEDHLRNVKGHVKNTNPYESRAFPIDDADYKEMLEESKMLITYPQYSGTSKLDIDSLQDSSKQGTISSPQSEVTDSAPEDIGSEDSLPPEWVISGKRNEAGEYILEVSHT